MKINALVIESDYGNYIPFEKYQELFVGTNYLKARGKHTNEMTNDVIEKIGKITLLINELKEHWKIKY